MRLARVNTLFLLVGNSFCAFLVACATVLPFAITHAHPVEFHLGPLEAKAVERVLSSLELLMQELKNAGRSDDANLPKDALGITGILWSIENAVAAKDKSWPTKSPTLLQALQSAGYEDSPYIVAEWKIEAERVLEAYEVLSANLQEENIRAGFAELENDVTLISEEERIKRERILIRQASMLQTTVNDISKVAPFRQQFDRLANSLRH